MIPLSSLASTSARVAMQAYPEERGAFVADLDYELVIIGSLGFVLHGAVLHVRVMCPNSRPKA